jgi:hypothetical protein
MNSFCHRFRDRAVAWLEEQLSASEAEQVAAHLEICSSCADYFSGLSAMEIRPPRLAGSIGGDFWDRMDSVIDTEMDKWEEPRRPLLSELGWKPWIVAAMALLCLAWGMQQYRKAEQLRTTVEHQAQQIERMQRAMQASPRSPQQPYVMPAVHVPSRMDL